MKSLRAPFALTLALLLLFGMTSIALAATGDQKLTVVKQGTNVTIDGPGFTTEGAPNYEAYLVADGGYWLPNTITVSLDAATSSSLTVDTDYTYNTSTGLLQVFNADGILDNPDYETLTITAVGVPMTQRIWFTKGSPSSVDGMPGTLDDSGKHYLDYETGETITMPEGKPTADGMEFTGWLREGTELVYQAGQTGIVVPAGGFTLVAQWTEEEPTDPVPATYKLTYKSGTTGSVTGMPNPATITITEDISFTTADAPRRDGYTFKGWEASWNGSVISPGASVTITSDNATEALSLTARWKSITSNPSISRYRIYSSSSVGGAISPDGWERYDRGDDQTYKFTPNKGYAIKAVYVDNKKVDTVNGRYTFTNIRKDHTIHVEFVKSANIDVPKTGDQANYGLALLLLSFAGFGLVLNRKMGKQ